MTNSTRAWDEAAVLEQSAIRLHETARAMELSAVRLRQEADRCSDLARGLRDRARAVAPP